MPVQPYLHFILAGFSRLDCDEQMLLFLVAESFCENANILEGEDADAFVAEIVKTFVHAGPMDALLVHSLRVICAVLPLVASRARSITEEIAPRLLQGITETTDTELVRYCLHFMSVLMTMDPASPIFSLCIDSVPLHLSSSDRLLMMGVWAFVSDILRHRSDLASGLIEPVVQAALTFENATDVECLSNVALVLFDVLPVFRVKHGDAEKLMEMLISGLRAADSMIDNMIDIQNLGCCLLRIWVVDPKLDFDESWIEKLIPYLESIEYVAVRNEVSRLLCELANRSKGD
jgi:hypothetical protein